MNRKQKIGTIVELTLDGERIIKAIVQESWAQLTDREFLSYKKSLSDWHEGDVALPVSPYHEAICLIRGSETSAAAIAAALGIHGPNGEEGNVWKLFDRRHATQQAEGLLWDCEAAVPMSAIRGTKIVVEEVDDWSSVGDEEDRAQTDEEAAAEYRAVQPEFEGRSICIGADIAWGAEDPDADDIEPDAILEDVDGGAIRVTSDGLAYVARIAYRTAGKRLARSNLRGPIYDLGEIERWLIAQQAAVAKLSRLPKGEVRDALLSIRGYREKLAASRVPEKTSVSYRSVKARCRLLNAIEKARAALAGDELDALLSQAIRGRAA